jgi:hypothetical protein
MYWKGTLGTRLMRRQVRQVVHMALTCTECPATVGNAGNESPLRMWDLQTLQRLTDHS